LERLTGRFRCLAQLAVLQGSEIVYLEQFGDRSSVPNITHIGGRLPAVSSSPGLMTAAFVREPELSEILDSRKVKYTQHTVVDKSALASLIDKAREDNFIQLDGWLHPLTTGISVPIFTAGGSVASISALVHIRSGHKAA